MRAVTGYMSPQRYGGIDKNLGPQYLRGICERNPRVPDKLIHLVYSNNKEDIWISHLPAQTDLKPERVIRERFNGDVYPEHWNIYSPAWSPIRMTGESLRLLDFDPCDRALIERNVAPAEDGKMCLIFCTKTVSQRGEICISLHDEAQGAPVEMYINFRHELRVRSAGRDEEWLEIPFGKKVTLNLTCDCLKSRFTLECEGKKGSFAMNTACTRIERISIATKSLRCIPYNDIYSNGKYGSNEDDLPSSGEKTDETMLDVYAFDCETVSAP